MISRVISPGLPLFTKNPSILITGKTPTVVLVRNASLHFFISLILKELSLTMNPFNFATLITQSLVTPPKIKLFAGCVKITLFESIIKAFDVDPSVILLFLDCQIS